MSEAQTTTAAANQPIVSFKVEGQELRAPREASLLEVLLEHGYELPHLCHHWAVKPYGACRLCLVEVKKGRKSKLTTSCNYPVLEGIEVTTKSERISRNRRMMLELLLAMAPTSDVLQKLAAEYGLKPADVRFKVDDDGDTCILCGLCVRVCREVVGVDALSFSGRGMNKAAVPPFKEAPESCIACGACSFICPTNCIGFRQVGTMREIPRWERKLPMRVCTRCGYPYAPIFQLTYFRNRARVPQDFFDLCPDCRE